MFGLMQPQPLLIAQLLDFAARHHPSVEVVSRRVEGDLHRYTYRDAFGRAAQVAHALDRLGIARCARVATLAWNGYRHFELYYGISGSGRILHTVNPRLIPEQVAWIANDAEDLVFCFDLTFLPVVEAIHAQCPSVRTWVALCAPESLPRSSTVPGLVAYEEWISAEPAHYDWPEFDENTASALCYTSGTTGDPKGVLYSHRSTLLHAYATALPDALGLSASDTVMPVVPMFHANAWGVPYGAPMTGARLVFPGAAVDGASLYDLIESEGVTLAAGVPTVWLGLLEEARRRGARFSKLGRVLIGGAACSEAMIRSFAELGVEVLHAWGMTEISPLGTVSRLKRCHDAASDDERVRMMMKQGRALFGVDMKIVGAEGNELPWDGTTSGALMVRGPWIISEYFRQRGGRVLVDGWLPTGDVATIDPEGFMQITDRTKDLIKSGGEWISSIDLENIAMSHPGVAMAACIAVAHPKWGERPLLVVRPQPGVALTKDALLRTFAGRVAAWQVPDDIVFVDTIPLGATGKMQKNKLREQFRNYRLPA